MRNAPTYKFTAGVVPAVSWHWRVICFFAALCPVAGVVLWEN